MQLAKTFVALAACLLLAACSEKGKVLPSEQSVATSSPEFTHTSAATPAPSAALAPKAMPSTDVKPTAAGTFESPAATKRRTIEMAGTPMKDQSFDSVAFEKFGTSRFVTTVEKSEDRSRLHFYVLGPKAEVELTYEPAAPTEPFYEMKAVAFKDVNADGLKDVIIIADYATGIGYMGGIPVSQVLLFTQTESGFVESKALEDHVYSVSPYRMLTIQNVQDMLKTDAKSGYAPAWAKLPLKKFELDGSGKYAGSTLTIEKTTGSSIVFSLSAFIVNGGDEGLKKGSVNVGNLESVTAHLSGSEMVYRDGEFELAISFISMGDLYLRDNGKSYFGMNVNVNGPYSVK